MAVADDSFHAQILSRLDDHGEEIRALRGLVERLVRIEERQQAHSDTFARFGVRIERLEYQIQQLNTEHGQSSVSIAWLERGLWLMCIIGAWLVNQWIHHGG
ncbi:hypothetical protein Nhal_1000 [Nitrosococcus halophilus Nc 4]|uniref:Uncharacterized protein n=1 Tax=Nitrosococcus halophilus (strain Nc4) TaxID=472759 RepID=D5BYW0_NITHN|nr:hypothetical protein [Nitrosococcus halophilus]ADE14173.1 hypothetical protein Nhal_1000 [Nitrosococcus halophilus Nc 4]